MSQEFYSNSDRKLDKEKCSIKKGVTGASGLTNLKVGDILLSWSNVIMVPAEVKTGATEICRMHKASTDDTTYTPMVETDKLTESKGKVTLKVGKGHPYTYIES